MVNSIFFFLTDEDEKTIINLENSNKSLSGELREVKKDFSQLQENLKISENMNLQFENQLNKTIRNLSTVMDEIHTVLKKVSSFILTYFQFVSTFNSGNYNVIKLLVVFLRANSGGCSVLCHINQKWFPKDCILLELSWNVNMIYVCKLLETSWKLTSFICISFRTREWIDFELEENKTIYFFLKPFIVGQSWETLWHYQNQFISIFCH